MIDHDNPGASAHNAQAIGSVLREKAKQRFGSERAGELQNDIEQTASQLEKLCAEPLSIDDET